MSAKGLEWARQLRAELEHRIEGLRDALAGIEPLQAELARLEQQLKGVTRLIAAYENELGYPKAGEAAPVPQPVVSRAELTRRIEAALVPLDAPESPNPAVVPRKGTPDLITMLRNGASLVRRSAVRCGLSVRVWLAERFPSNNLS
ncbi:MAG TPA: hypothetical protein VIA80_02565 [Hyphomonadaceae bacterium]|jgi:hypothetical protein